MKLIRTVLATVLTAALFFSPVLAAEGDTSSPTKGDGPKVVSATDASGKDISGYIVTTKMGTTSDIAKINEYLNNAKKDLDAAIAASEKGIGVKFAGLSADERKLSVAFARKIKSLSASEQAKLERILL